MKIKYIGKDWSFVYACDELARGYQNLIDEILSIANKVAENTESDKTLIVVRGCPCCSTSCPSGYQGNNYILISPLAGIDKCGCDIKNPTVMPPFRNPGTEGECTTAEEFLKVWEKVIEEALKT